MLILQGVTSVHEVGNLAQSDSTYGVCNVNVILNPGL